MTESTDSPAFLAALEAVRVRLGLDKSGNPNVHLVAASSIAAAVRIAFDAGKDAGWNNGYNDGRADQVYFSDIDCEVSP